MREFGIDGVERRGETGVCRGGGARKQEEAEAGNKKKKQNERIKGYSCKTG